MNDCAKVMEAAIELLSRNVESEKDLTSTAGQSERMQQWHEGRIAGATAALNQLKRYLSNFGIKGGE